MSPLVSSLPVKFIAPSWSASAGLAVFLKNLKKGGLASALVFSNVMRGFSDVDDTIDKSVSSHVKSADY